MAKRENRKMKPTAIAITDWQPYKEVIYKCSKCGQSFRMLGDKERFCHTCGTEVDWNGVIKNLPKPFNKDDYDGEQKLIADINKKQLNYRTESKRFR